MFSPTPSRTIRFTKCCNLTPPVPTSQTRPGSPPHSSHASYTGAHRHVTRTCSTLSPEYGPVASSPSDCCWWAQHSSHSHRKHEAASTGWKTFPGTSMAWRASCLWRRWGQRMSGPCPAEWERPPKIGRSGSNLVVCPLLSPASQYLTDERK